MSIYVETLELMPLGKLSGMSFGTCSGLAKWLKQTETIVFASLVTIDGPDALLLITLVGPLLDDYEMRGIGTIIPEGKGVSYKVAGGTKGAVYEAEFAFTTSTGDVLGFIQPWHIKS